MAHDDKSSPRSWFTARAGIAFTVVVAALASGGCDVPRLPGVYRIDVQQGNVVTRSMVDQLEIGMEKRKVRFIMGTPLLVDSFNPDRWDYLYVLRPGSGPVVTHRVSVFFVDDRLDRIEDRLGADLAQDEERTQRLVKVPKQRSRQGILYRLVPDFSRPNDEEDATQSADEGSDAAASPPGDDSSE